MNNDESPTSPADVPVFLIVVREVIVGQDIAEGIALAVPGARVLVARTLEESVALLRDVSAVALAFVAAGAPAFDRSALAGALAVRGARVVLMGHAAEEAAPEGSAQILRFPFDSGAVEAHLAAFRGNSERH